MSESGAAEVAAKVLRAYRIRLACKFAAALVAAASCLGVGLVSWWEYASLSLSSRNAESIVAPVTALNPLRVDVAGDVSVVRFAPRSYEVDDRVAVLAPRAPGTPTLLARPGAGHLPGLAAAGSLMLGGGAAAALCIFAGRRLRDQSRGPLVEAVFDGWGDTNSSPRVGEVLVRVADLPLLVPVRKPRNGFPATAEQSPVHVTGFGRGGVRMHVVVNDHVYASAGLSRFA